jgi:predicted nucleotidyltransferase
MFKKLNLFSKTEMRVLMYIALKNGQLYERQIAQGAEISVGSANSILKTFSEIGLVHRIKKGRMSFYERKDGNPLLRQFKVFITVNNLMPLIQKIIQHSRRIILYGSASTGRNNEESDIDLFILSTEKEEIRRILDKFETVQAIILDSNEYMQLQKKDKPLYDRISVGIELYGGNID